MSSPSSLSSRSSLQLFTDTFKKSKLPKEYFPLKLADFPNRTLLDTSLVLGYDKEPWLALLLVALWFPVVLNPAATQKLLMPDQGTLFTMVASALDNYTRWIMHPQYSEPVVILALKMGILKYYKGNLLFRRILKNFPAANTSYDDAAYEEGHRTLDEERHTIGKRLDQKVLLEVQPLAQPLPTGAACPEFPKPEVLPNHYVDIPREGSNLAYPKDNEFPSVVNQEDLPPRFQWIWYVKEDLLKSVFGLSLPKDLRLWLSSPASSVDDDISMADPSETSGTPKAKLADFEADWLKDAFGADFVDEFEAAASPLGYSPSDSGSSDRPLAEKPSSERPPEETKKTSKRKLPASAESAPVAPKKKKREIKLGPSGVGCNLAPSKLGRSLDLAAEHAKFSLVHLDALAQDKSRAQLQFELAAANYALAAGNLASSSYRVTSCLVKADTAFPRRLEELTRDSRSSSTLKEEIANLEELVEWFEKNSGSQKKKNPPPREFLREELERPQSHHAPGSKARSAGRKVRKN
ncbi:hypothetical protein K435DRAFT_793078 [Dendrothele bispora CBS 962.96]|uniref:Uncharacterized protein n=1 Tax=Dendrothele bispora (strain CBS 962.96) TaxID=1314807 RepID=A0A4V4HH83_DENBC|nr:hypothetical protein K435DRAFT_793078 [Dendrothele bispora CBS 962.96]